MARWFDGRVEGTYLFGTIFGTGFRGRVRPGNDRSQGGRFGKDDLGGRVSELCRLWQKNLPLGFFSGLVKDCTKDLPRKEKVKLRSLPRHQSQPKR